MATDVGACQVDVSEFRENIDHFLESTTAVRITRDGETVGVFTPLPKPQKLTAEEADARSLELAKLQAEFLGQMAKAGVTEEGLMRDIDELQRQKHARRS